MQLYLTATPEQSARAAGMGFRFSHSAYQIGTDRHLHRRSGPPQTRLGLLSLSGLEPPNIQAPTQLCREIQRECINRGFEGVAADFGSQPTPDRLSFLQELAPQLQRSDKRLFVSAAYGKEVPEAAVLINTALSGGTLQAMLQDACHIFHRQRIALDIERLCMDFPLPCPSGIGTALEKSAFHTLLQKHSPHTFFSHELCAKYFTYQAEGQSHFVLFDDADTLRCKIKLGQQLDLSWAFLLCSEVEDLLPALQGA